MSIAQVKVCGLTRLEDAVLAADLGAAMLGYIFADSPRRASIDAVREINHSVTAPIQKIGVFVNASLEEILHIYKYCGLTGIQLHGAERPSFVQELKQQLKNAYVIKALDASTIGIAETNSYASDALLFDAPRLVDRPRGLLDGEIIQTAKPHLPYFIAGGLNADNVKYYIQTLNPFGVDVASGVESSPGIKDARALQKFFHAVRSAT